MFLKLSILVVVFAISMCLASGGRAEEKKSAGASALGFVMKDIQGKEVDLAQYQGKVVLMVNVASKCGYTSQYKGLQELHAKYGEKGLAVLGFPCNQFGGQEPGSEKDIQEFCEANYGVKFALFSKVDVNGAGAAPLFKYLTSDQAPVEDKGAVKWNFEKFLIGRDGKVLARFRSKDKPEEIAVAVEKALAESAPKK